MERNINDDDTTTIRAPDHVFRDRLIDDGDNNNINFHHHNHHRQQQEQQEREQKVINESIIEHEIQTLFNLLEQNQITQEEFNQLYGFYLEDQSSVSVHHAVDTIADADDTQHIEAAIQASNEEMKVKKEQEIAAIQSFYMDRDYPNGAHEFITYLQRMKTIDQLTNNLLTLYQTSITYGNEVLVSSKHYDELFRLIEFILRKTNVSKKITDEMTKMRIVDDFKRMVKPIYDIDEDMMIDMDVENVDTPLEEA